MATMIREEALCQALFASHLQRSETLSPEGIRDAIDTTVGRLGEVGCAALVAQEFGEHPESAVGRMQWARSLVRDACPDSSAA